MRKSAWTWTSTNINKLNSFDLEIRSLSSSNKFKQLNCSSISIITPLFTCHIDDALHTTFSSKENIAEWLHKYRNEKNFKVRNFDFSNAISSHSFVREFFNGTDWQLVRKIDDGTAHISKLLGTVLYQFSLELLSFPGLLAYDVSGEV